ncbi:MAG: hypothetical protein WC014_01025, partial [Bacilli bacterium]
MSTKSLHRIIARGDTLSIPIVSLLLFLSFFLPATITAATVEGKVTSEGEGLPNVVVTDGYQC